jgi:dUTPase
MDEQHIYIRILDDKFDGTLALKPADQISNEFLIKCIEDTTIAPQTTAAVRTGFGFDLFKSQCAQISFLQKYALQGIIFSPTYIEPKTEVKLILHNVSNKEFALKRGDDLATFCIHQAVGKPRIKYVK